MQLLYGRPLRNQNKGNIELMHAPDDFSFSQIEMCAAFMFVVSWLRDIWDHGRCGERLAGASGDADLLRGAGGPKRPKRNRPISPQAIGSARAETGRGGAPLSYHP